MTDMPKMHPDTPSPNRAQRLESALREGFAASLVRVVDDSARHAGHSGARPEGETHYNVLAVSERFRGMSRIARSRAVHDLLAGEFTGGMHALSLTLRTPEEQAKLEH